MKLTYVGHACIMVEENGKTVVIDPFLTDPVSAKKKFPQLFSPDYVFLTHGHDDHIGALSDVCRPQTKIVGIVELCSYLRERGYKNVYGMNFGGTVDFGDVRVSLVPAVHTSSVSGRYLGAPAGVVFTFGKKTFYHMGDTDVFGDMAYVEKFYRPQIGFVPIGGRYTMDAEKAAFCCNTFFRFEKIIPIHYNTFAGIQADPEDFAKITNSDVLPLSPLSSLEL